MLVNTTFSAEDEVQVEKSMQSVIVPQNGICPITCPCNLYTFKGLSWGEMEVHMDIQNGIIQQCLVYGDFY